MVIRTYFDASGTWHDPNCTHMTLAGFVATKEQWDIFEGLWDTALLQHKAPLSREGNPYWHSSEAFHLREGFDGWDEDRVELLALELFNVLNKLPLDTLYGFAATVPKSDYELARMENPKLMDPHVLCLEHCFSLIVTHAKETDPQPLLDLIFDENEPFEPIISRCLKRGVWWRDLVGGHTSTNRMRNLYPLQLCDLMAWLFNRYHSSRTENRDEWHEMAPVFTLTIPYWHVLYDKATLKLAVDPKGRYITSNLKRFAFGCEARNLVRWVDLFYGKAHNSILPADE